MSRYVHSFWFEGDNIEALMCEAENEINATIENDNSRIVSISHNLFNNAWGATMEAQLVLTVMVIFEN